MRSRVTFFILLSAVAGCDGAGATAGGGGAGGGGAGEGYSVAFGSVTVSPGEEGTQRVVKRLDNPAAMHVHRIENKLGPGSHHLIVYRTSDTVVTTGAARGGRSERIQQSRRRGFGGAHRA